MQNKKKLDAINREKYQRFDRALIASLIREQKLAEEQFNTLSLR